MSNIFISDPNGEPISYYYQWDADQTVVISGLTISESPKVHFCNTTSNKSIVVKPLIVGNTITAKVPNILLQSTDSIIIYVYNTNADSGSRTIYTSRIAVIPRAKPEDYVYTETEVLQYSTLDARIRALENSVDGTGGCIYVGDTEPTDPNVGIWIDTSEDLTPPYIPNTMAKPGQIVRVVTVDENGAIVAVEAVDMPSGGESYELPAATADTLGGVKALPATHGDTQPVRIGVDGMLYTAPGSGGGEVWETINEAEVEGVVMTELACNFDDYRKVIIMLDGFGTSAVGKVNAHYGYPDSDTTKQICQTIETTSEKKYGYITFDTVTGQIVYTTKCHWAHAASQLMTTPDSMSIRNHVGATKVVIMAIDSNGGGATPSATNTMMGKIKLLGVRK